MPNLLTPRRQDAKTQSFGGQFVAGLAAFPVLFAPRRLCAFALNQSISILLFVIPIQSAVAQSDAHTAHDSSSSDIPTMLFVFMLATFIGMGVITRVSRLLHTPLMSITNAISAIAVVGAISVAGSKHPFYINLLGAIALFASTTNIVSGFLITDRMLKMFKRDERKP
jgi:NAD(P) transhydrogenase subunit alpha